jgi:hypothetical protein
VLISLADAYNEEMNYAFPSVQLMQEQTSLSRSGVKKALDELEAKSIIESFERRTDEGRQTTNGYILGAYQGVTERPLPTSGKSKGKTLRGPHSDPSRGHTVTPNLEEEPIGSSSKNRDAPKRRTKKKTWQPSEPDQDDTPIRDADTGERVSEPPRQRLAAAPPAKSLPARRDFSRLTAAAAAADSPHRIALRFKELTKQQNMKTINPANLQALSAVLKNWYTEGLELADMKEMVDLFVKHPDTYMTGLQDIPWRAFINARVKLQADGTKISKAKTPRAAGGMLSRAAAR